MSDRTRCAMERLEDRRLLSADLFADLSPNGLAASDMMQFGKRAVFAGNTERYGRELWITDGTPAGTRVIADIVRGPEGSSPRPIGVSGNYLYFTVDDSIGTRRGLWRTDGKGKNTIKLVADWPDYFEAFADVGGRALFIYRNRIWLSDGTLQGTGPTDQVFPEDSGVYGLLGAGTDAYTLVQMYAETSLWRFDSLTQQSQRLMTLHGLGGVAPMGRTVYVAAQFNDARGIWRIKTGQRPVLLKRFYDAYLPPTQGQVLWFVAREKSTSPFQLWQYGATGFRQMTDLPEGAITTSSIFGISPGAVVFSATGGELWAAQDSDIAATRVHVFADPNPTKGGGHAIRGLAALPGGLFATVGDKSVTQLWRLSETVDQPELLGRVVPDAPLMVTSSSVLFSRIDETGFPELHGVDVATPPVQLTDVTGGKESSDPGQFTRFKDGMLFATDARHQSFGLWGRAFALWYTDGQSRPVQLASVRRSEIPSPTEPIGIVAAGDVAYFAFRTNVNEQAQYELWITDGTKLGTRRIRTGLGNLVFLAGGDGRGYFAELDPTGHRARVWTTDGTGAGTRTLKEFTDYSNDARKVFTASAVWQGDLYTSYGDQLYRADGSAGTFANVSSILQDVSGKSVTIREVALRGEKLILAGDLYPTPGVFTDSHAAVWELTEGQATAARVVTLDWRTAVVDLFVDADGKHLWLLARTGSSIVSPLALHRIDADTRSLVTSAEFAFQGAFGRIVGRFANRMVVRMGGSSDELSHVWASDATSGRTKFLKQARGVQGLTVLNNSLVYLDNEDALWRLDSVGGTPTWLGWGNADFQVEDAEMISVGGRAFYVGNQSPVHPMYDPGAELFSYQPGGTIDGTVFSDANGNGVLEDGEAGLLGWRVFIDRDADGICDKNERFVRTTSTGRFLFEDLVPGTYRLSITRISTYVPTTAIPIIVTVSGGQVTPAVFGMKPIA